MRSHRFPLALTMVYAVSFAAIYGGTSWLSARRDPPTVPHFALETAIPFVPAMAWLYLSVPVMLCAAPLVMRAKREAKRAQASAQSLDDLVALGRARGMKNPHGWARHVLAAREAKGRGAA